MDQIRNFCIIAHIDHGKSTLADRMLQHREFGYQVVGFIDDRAEGDHIGYRGLPLLGTLREAGDIAVVPNHTVHQHNNADPQRPARVLVLKTKPMFIFMNMLFQKTVEKRSDELPPGAAGFQVREEVEDYQPIREVGPAKSGIAARLQAHGSDTGAGFRADVVGAEWQNRRHVDPHWYLGKGKAEALSQAQAETGFTILIADDDEAFLCAQHMQRFGAERRDT